MTDTVDAQRSDAPLPVRTRWQVVRDIAVFQVKLFVDGLRDVLLMPASFVLGIVGVLVSRRPGEPFYRLLRAGKSTELWLDLFGAAYRRDEDQPDSVDHAENWRQLEAQLRELDTSLRDGDYKGAARDGANRLRRTVRDLLDSRKDEPS